MADADSEAVVDALVRDLGASPDGPTVLALLDGAARSLVESDLVHRLLPFARGFRTLDFAEHPWAGLVAGVALCAVDRHLGRATLHAAREYFARDGDAEGEGYGCFLEGLEDIGEGHIESATERWSHARELLGGKGPVEGMALAHLALGAYAEGDLARAHLMAGESLATTRMQADDRLAGIACMYLGFVDVHTGEFGHADAVVAEGLAALGRLEPDNRYEWPMLPRGGRRGGVAARRRRRGRTRVDRRARVLRPRREPVVRGDRACRARRLHRAARRPPRGR